MAISGCSLCEFRIEMARRHCWRIFSFLWRQKELDQWKIVKILTKRTFSQLEQQPKKKQLRWIRHNDQLFIYRIECIYRIAIRCGHVPCRQQTTRTTHFRYSVVTYYTPQFRKFKAFKFHELKATAILFHIMSKAPQVKAYISHCKCISVLRSRVLSVKNDSVR